MSEYPLECGWTAGGAAPAACSMMLAAGLSISSVQVDTIAYSKLAESPQARSAGESAEASASFVCSGRLWMQEELKVLLGRYCDVNWNGYGESSISEKSWNAAYAFVKSLPQWVSGAEVLVDADGEVSLEWYRSKDYYLELSFADSGVTHCYFKTPARKCSCIFARVNDPLILDFIGQVSNAG